MDTRLVKYLEGRMSGEERLDFLREAACDKALGEEFIACRRIDALYSLDRGGSSGEEEAGIAHRSWKRFIRRRHLASFGRMSGRLCGVALAVFACVLGTLAVDSRIGVPRDPVPTLSTFAPAGQRAVQTLPDGTKVWLNAGSTLSYPSVFSGERRVTIDGEAFFEVAPDPSKPFIVSTGKLEVKALGTKFNVFNYPLSPLAVSLLEGSVALYERGGEDGAVVLESGEQLVESSSGYIKRAFAPESVQWMDGYYSFRNQTMGDVLSRLELYYDVRLVVSDSTLLDKTFTGKFRQTDGVREVLRILGQVHPFSIREDKSLKTIYLE